MRCNAATVPGPVAKAMTCAARHSSWAGLSVKKCSTALLLTNITASKSAKRFHAFCTAAASSPLAAAIVMSGNATAFRDMIDNMCHGGKIAMLGIPSEQIAIDWNKVIFNMLTIHGIYGREMYETWYQMSVMLESGVNIKPVITHRFHYTDFEQGFAAMESGNCGKVVLDWTK